MDKKLNLKDLSQPDLERFIATLGKEKYRAGQIMKAIYQQGVASIAEMTTLSKDFRKKLDDIAEISNLEVVRIQSAADETRKILFRLADALCIESVVIPGKSHPTLCISTQVGCRMGCAFCLTGKQGMNLPVASYRVSEEKSLCYKDF